MKIPLCTFCCMVLFSSTVFSHNATVNPATGQLVPARGKRLVELKGHQADRLNAMAQQQEQAQKKGISSERNFQMQQEKQREQQRALKAESNQPISYAPKR